MTGSSLDRESVRVATSCSSVTHPSLATVSRDARPGLLRVPDQRPSALRAQLGITALSWQKCTRVGSADLTRCSHARHAVGSAAWPGGRLASSGPPYCTVVYAAPPISTSTSSAAPAAPLTRTD